MPRTPRLKDGTMYLMDGGVLGLRGEGTRSWVFACGVGRRGRE